MLFASLALLLLASPQEPSVVVHDAAPLANGDLLLAREDGLIVAVDARTGEDRATFARHAAAVRDLALDPRGEFVAASSADGRVALWPVHDPDSKREDGYPGRYARPRTVVRPEPETWGDAAQVAWLHGGAHLVTWTEDWQVGPSPTAAQVWTRAGELVWTGIHARQVSVSPTEEWLATVDEDVVVLYRPGGEEQRVRLEGALTALEISPDGLRLAVGGRERRLWILDVPSGEVRLEVQYEPSEPFPELITRLRWSPDGGLLGGTMGKGMDPFVVDPASGAKVWDGDLLGARMWLIFDVAWTPDGKRLVHGFGDTSAVDPRTGEVTSLFEEAEVFAVVPIGNDDAFVVLTWEKTARFEADLGEPIWQRTDRPGGVGTVVR